ncbi:MAG TPA: 4Fe-4S binding protein [Tepidisphaeraceae bacterium]|nr:4Fe-4S binding protein [Tepidisphaeraceae bacterium]
MAYVIAQPCIGVKDTACITVCPVDCIHPGPAAVDFERTDQLFIDPGECIHCHLCVDECPVGAIFADDDLPPEWRSFIQKNASYFRESKDTR